MTHDESSSILRRIEALSPSIKRSVAAIDYLWDGWDGDEPEWDGVSDVVYYDGFRKAVADGDLITCRAILTFVDDMLKEGPVSKIGSGFNYGFCDSLHIDLEENRARPVIPLLKDYPLVNYLVWDGEWRQDFDQFGWHKPVIPSSH